jgi:hypothetical protein
MRPTAQNDIGFDGRIAPGIEDLSGMNFGDLRGHDLSGLLEGAD